MLAAINLKRTRDKQPIKKAIDSPPNLWLEVLYFKCVPVVDIQLLMSAENTASMSPDIKEVEENITIFVKFQKGIKIKERLNSICQHLICHTEGILKNPIVCFLFPKY